MHGFPPPQRQIHPKPPLYRYDTPSHPPPMALVLYSSTGTIHHRDAGMIGYRTAQALASYWIVKTTSGHALAHLHLHLHPMLILILIPPAPNSLAAHSMLTLARWLAGQSRVEFGS